MSIPTPHINAPKDAFAKTVLMPGDPLRAKWIAENFLEAPKEVNNIRGMLGYTGTYNGAPVSVMGSGMGCASMGIYSYELYNFYGVESIIRVGSAGAINMALELGDVVMGSGACTESNYPALAARVPGVYAPVASFDLMLKVHKTAEIMGIKLHAGNVLSSDIFYNANTLGMNEWLRMGVLAVEMEAAALYANAALANKHALCLCTISDKVFSREEQMTAKERETTFTKMIDLALSSVIA